MVVGVKDGGKRPEFSVHEPAEQRRKTEEGTAVKEGALKGEPPLRQPLDKGEGDLRAHRASLHQRERANLIFPEITKELLHLALHRQQIGAVATVSVERRHDDEIILRKVLSERLAVLTGTHHTVNQQRRRTAPVPKCGKCHASFILSLCH